MKDFVKRMIAEHQELVERIAKLDEYVYTEKSDNDDKVEFANKCIQLAAMKKYEEALRARLENQNIVCTPGEYFEKVNTNSFCSEEQACKSPSNVNNCDGECKSK